MKDGYETPNDTDRRVPADESEGRPMGSVQKWNDKSQDDKV